MPIRRAKRGPYAGQSNNQELKEQSVFIYTLALIFFIIPLTIRAYLSLKAGKLPLPVFQNNIVVQRIKIRNAIGIVSPILFYAFHAVFALYALAIEAWLSSLAAIVYMVVSPMLSAQIKARGIAVVLEKAAGDAGTN